ncbi:hypothetical protein ACWKWP_02765 [Agromyces soli]
MRTAILAAAGTVLLLAGCTAETDRSPTAPDLVADAIPQREIDCRMPGDPLLENAPATSPKPPEPGRVPAGFEPVAALLCAADVSADGSGSAKVGRYEGDLEPLLRALAEPDDAPTPGLMCAAYAELLAPLWLEDAAARLIPVRWPMDACAHSKAATHDALAQLELVEVVELD